MSKVLAWVRQPSTLGGLAGLAYLAAGAITHTLTAAELGKGLAGCAVLLLVSDNTAGAAKAAQTVAVIETLAAGAPPAP